MRFDTWTGTEHWLKRCFFGFCMGTGAVSCFCMESCFSTDKNSCFQIPNRSTTCRTWILHPLQSIRNPIDLYFSCVQWEVPSSKYVLMLLFGASKHKAVRTYPWFLVYYHVESWPHAMKCSNISINIYLQCIYIFYLSIYTSMYTAKQYMYLYISIA